MSVLLRVLFMLLLFVPCIPASFFFMSFWGRYPKNKKEWIIGGISLAYVPIYFAIIHYWPDLKL
jgi:hypothetical protein